MKRPSVLMISVGEHMLFDKLSDARDRHIEYGKHIKKLIIFTYSKRKHSLSLSSISKNVAIKPSKYGKWLFPFEALFSCIRLIREHELNVITTQDPFVTGLIGVVLKFIFKIPLDIQNHSDFFSSREFINEKPLQYRAFYHIGKLILKYADHLRVLNEEERDEYIRMGIPEHKISVLATPVNSDRFLLKVSDEEKKNLKDSLNLNGKFLIIWVGRITPAKDWKLLIKIAGYLDDCDFLVAGSGEDDKDFDEEIRKNSIKNIIRLGKVSHEKLPLYYQIADIYLHTASYEGFGKTIVEAMFSGLPIVSSNVSGPRSIIENNKDGFLIDSRSPKDFSDKILQIKNDEGLRIRLSSNAFKKAISDFSRKKMIENITKTWFL